MIKKICVYCEKDFDVKTEQVRKLFCNDKCKDKLYREIDEYEKYIKKQKELLYTEYELIETQKELILLKETSGIKGYQIQK